MNQSDLFNKTLTDLLNKYIKNMKNIYSKISLLLVATFLVTFGFAQENSISPIFSVSASNGSMENTLASINQKTGANLSIEDFSSESYLGNNFTVSTLESSNVDKIYFLNNSNNLSVYDLPYFFDPEYTADQNELIISNNITDLDYHHQSAYIYAYDLNSENLFTISPNSGIVSNTINIPFSSSVENFSIETTNNYIVLNGKESGPINLSFLNLTTTTHSEISLSTDFVELNLIGNQHLNKLYAIAKDINDKNWLLEINPITEEVNTIGELPSCSNCSTEDYSYDKNGIALDWENNQILTILTETTASITKHFLMTFDLANAEQVYFSALDKKYSNLYFNKASADLVFPGDTNHDGIVDSKDLFSIGLKYSFNTIARFTQNTNWIGQHSFNTGVIKQGVDVKHADCNGDGIINTEDIEAIKENYSYIHNSNKTSASTGTDCDYPLAFTFPSGAYENNDVTIYIKLGEIAGPVTDVYGVDFTVNYNNSFVVPGTMKTTTFNSWFGTDNNNFNRADFDDHPNSKIDVNVTGNDLLNRSGGGDIIALSWTMEDDVVPIIDISSQMNLSISDITIININQDILESCGEDTSLAVYHKDIVSITTINNKQIEIYPNPAQTVINIESDEKIDFIEFYSITGKLIKSIDFINKTSVDISDFSNGVYYLKILSEDKTYMDKIIVD
jgi:hypothetical protein